MVSIVLCVITFGSVGGQGMELSVAKAGHIIDPVPPRQTVPLICLEPYPIPNYYEHIVRYFDLGTQGIKQWEDRYDPGTADIALRLWNRTGDDAFREKGLTLFKAIMVLGEEGVAGSRWNRQYGDFDSYPIVHAAFLLEQHGLLETRWKEQLRSEVLALQEKGLHWRYGNRELGKLAGPVFAAFVLFADDPAFAHLRDRARKWWQDLNAVGCLDESSGNYSSLGLGLLITIVRSMHCETDLRDNSRWHQNFAIYRDLVSPSGHMPEWGDDYFAEGGKLTWCYLFEYAANLYQEPSFALAARKLFTRLSRDLETKTRVKMGGLRQAIDLLDVKPMEATVPLAMVSGVNYRYNAVGQRRPFSLLLRPDLEPGSPQLMMDLYSLGDHAHMEKRGSVTYYEQGHIPLFHGRNRNHGRHAGDGGNNFYLQPEGGSFPFQPWQRDTWYTVRVPTERFGLADGVAEKNRRIFTHYYGNFRKKNRATLCLDHLRLEGPAGVKILDSFDDKTEGYYPQTYYVQEGSGRSVLKIPGEATSFSMHSYNEVFDPEAYRTLAYDIKWTGEETPDIGFRYNEDSLNMYNAWHKPGPLRPFYADLKGAHVETRKRDCYGQVTFSGYGTWDSPFTRRMVLTREGFLIIRDTIQVGPSADRWTGGEIWQFQEKDAQGEFWFAGAVRSGHSCVRSDSHLYQRGMLVLFDRKGPDAFQTQQVRWTTSLQRWLAFTRFKLRSSERYTRSLVIIPYSQKQRPAQLVTATEVTASDVSTRVVFTHLDQRLTVALDENGRWQVIR